MEALKAIDEEARRCPRCGHAVNFIQCDSGWAAMKPLDLAVCPGCGIQGRPSLGTKAAMSSLRAVARSRHVNERLADGRLPDYSTFIAIDLALRYYDGGLPKDDDLRIHTTAAIEWIRQEMDLYTEWLRKQLNQSGDPAPEPHPGTPPPPIAHQLWHAVFAIDGQPEPTEVYVAIRSGVAKEAAVAALARSKAPESPGFRWISLSHLGVVHIPQP